MKIFRTIALLSVALALTLCLISCNPIKDNDGSTDAHDRLTYEAFVALSAEGQREYYDSFEDYHAFYAWYNEAKATYEREHPGEQLPGNGDISIDIEGIVPDDGDDDPEVEGGVGIGGAIPDEDEPGNYPSDDPEDITPDYPGNYPTVEPDKEPEDNTGNEEGNAGGDDDTEGATPSEPTTPDNGEGDGTTEGTTPSEPTTPDGEGDGTTEGTTPSEPTTPDSGASDDSTEDTTPSEPTVPDDGDTSPLYPTMLKYEEFKALSPEAMEAYMNSFPSIHDFVSWREAAWDQYMEENKGEQLPEDGNIDLGGE